MAGGSATVGINQAPTGCNPHTPSGNTWANNYVLGAVLPGAYHITAQGESAVNPNLVQQAELISTTPETVVYTLNPKAVWSDGVPITAADFIYDWQQQRGAYGGATAARLPAPRVTVTSIRGGERPWQSGDGQVPDPVRRLGHVV